MNTAEDLRAFLFESLRDVKNGAIDKDQAKSIVEISQVIVNSAKVEVEAARHGVHHSESGFLAHDSDCIVGRTTHRIR